MGVGAWGTYKYKTQTFGVGVDKTYYHVKNVINVEKDKNIIEEGIIMYSIHSTSVANTIYQNFIVICILIQYKLTNKVAKFIKAL